MAILTLQFGQCGNQIGHSLFTYVANDMKNVSTTNIPKSLSSEYTEKSMKQWFSEKTKSNHLVPRSISVDTENKVISSIVKGKHQLKYRNIVAKSDGGSANNWAYGYGKSGERIKEEVLELVRKEVEKCDEVVKIFSILSSAGGTGSGAGSRIIEAIRDDSANKTMVNAVVLPYTNGEIVTQSYNTLLTLSKLYDLTDGCVLFKNEQLHKICSDLLAIKDVALTNINDVISQKLAAVFQPAHNYSLSSFVTQLTSHPSYKFVSIKATPYIPVEYMMYESTQDWPILIGHVRKTLRASSQSWESKPLSLTTRTYSTSRHCKSLASLLISRGGIPPTVKMLQPLVEEGLYAGWVPQVDRLKHYHQPRQLCNTSNFLALASNNNSVCHTLETVLEQAWTLFNHKAYLHQYGKFGVGEEDFNEAFEKLECVNQSYKSL